MSDFDNTWIDEQLRGVPLPPALLPRLREIASLADGELDCALRAVPMPAALLDRLHAIGSLTDIDIDDDARDVGLPRGVVPRLRRSVRRQAWRTRLARLAIAASLFFVIGGAGWIIVKQMQIGVEPPLPVNDGSIAANGNDPPRPPQPETRHPETRPPEIAAPVRGGDPQIVKTPDWPHVIPAPPPDPHQLVDVSPAAPNQSGESSALPSTGVTEPEQSLNTADVLGNTPLATEPDLRVARGVTRHGIAGPRVKGYDLLFEFRYGEHPVVHPGKTASLLESRIPIWTETSGYELARRAIAARQSLPAGQIRAEDFLAAMDYEFPAPTGAGIGIRTAAGPSPLGLPGTSLMQIGVQAGKFDRGRDFGTHLTLAVDASATVASAERWEAMRRAIADLVEQLGPRDRLSIVLFNQRPIVLVRQADRAEMRKLLPSLETIAPRGLANLGAALEMATAVARPEPATVATTQSAGAEKASTKLLLLTDGIGWIEPSAMSRVKELLKETVASGMSWEVVDVRPDEVSDPHLDDLASVGGRGVRHAETGRAIARELRESLLGRPDVVAGGVSVKVTFNPEAIESYRLVGHDPTTAGGLISGPVEGDLRAGEATTALYEVELKPDGADTVATVEVSWHEPGTEDMHHLKQPIGRLQFAPSWTETPLSLQLATLAAETAEILHNSYFAPTGSRPLDQVAELADRANGALRGRQSFRDLKAILDMARSPRTSGR